MQSEHLSHTPVLVKFISKHLSHFDAIARIILLISFSDCSMLEFRNANDLLLLLLTLSPTILLNLLTKIFLFVLFWNHYSLVHVCSHQFKQIILQHPFLFW